MLDIGGIEIPIVSEFETEEESSVSEIDSISSIDNIAVKHESALSSVSISGFLNQEVHSDQNSIEKQKSDLKRLRKRDVSENPINFQSYKGHLFIESIDFNESSNSVIVEEVTIEGRFYPWPKFFPENEP